jgi:hypothetical protein
VRVLAEEGNMGCHPSDVPYRFETGQISVTSNALTRLPAHDVFRAIGRHIRGDWGEVGEEDRKENELSLSKGFRLLSVYTATNGVKFWIITEADRSSTTVLLPEDY